jgi:hypothetical protein
MLPRLSSFAEILDSNSSSLVFVSYYSQIQLDMSRKLISDAAKITDST